MPYIITTRKPEQRWADAGYTVYDLPTRTAVATLDEARKAVIAAGERAGAWIGGDALHGPIDRGQGTVGPLPDGTVIEVKRVGWPDLAAQVQSGIADPNPSEAAILAAFNQVQA